MRHLCHHPYCDTPVPPRLLACRRHWFVLPTMLRDGIWATYVPGQENRKDPSAAYLEAVAECLDYWRDHPDDSADQPDT